MNEDVKYVTDMPRVMADLVRCALENSGAEITGDPKFFLATADLGWQIDSTAHYPREHRESVVSRPDVQFRRIFYP